MRFEKKLIPADILVDLMDLNRQTDYKDLSLSSDLTRISSSSPASLLSPSITPSHFHSYSKLIFSTNLFLRSSTFPPTRLTPRTPGVFFVFLGHVGFNFGIVC